MTESIAGCRCGAVELVITVPVTVLGVQRGDWVPGMNGGAFSTYAPLSRDAVRVSRGQDVLVSYAVTPRATKHWCGACGTPLFNRNVKYPDLTMVYYGALHDAESVTPRANIYCTSKLAWVDSIATLKSYDETRFQE